MIRLLENVLKPNVECRHHTWVQQLPLAESAVNNVVSISTGFTLDTLAWATGTHVDASDHAIELFCIEYGCVMPAAGPHGRGPPLEAASKERHSPGGPNYTKGRNVTLQNGNNRLSILVTVSRIHSHSKDR